MKSINHRNPNPNTRFPKFSDSPAWKVRKLGDIFGERVEKGFPEKTVLSATQDKGVIPFDILGKTVIRDRQNLTGYKLVEKGDFVVSLRSFEGGFEYSQYEGIISPAYVVLYRKEAICDGFYQYLFKSRPFIASLQTLLNNNLRDGKSISYNQAKNFNLLIPDLDEQEAIASCMGSVDQLIEKEKRRLILLARHKEGLMQDLFAAFSNS